MSDTTILQNSTHVIKPIARDLGLHPESRGEPLKGLKQEKEGTFAEISTRR